VRSVLKRTFEKRGQANEKNVLKLKKRKIILRPREDSGTYSR